ncbi:MAG TPA: hypothetical protein VF257_14990 [Solirubrobacteraceae bacterium]
MVMIKDVTPVLLEHARRQLAWLRDDGYEESNSLVVGSAFHLRFAGAHGELIPPD